VRNGERERKGEERTQKTKDGKDNGIHSQLIDTGKNGGTRGRW